MRKVTIIGIVIVGILVTVVLCKLAHINIPFVSIKSQVTWSIGICVCKSPFAIDFEGNGEQVLTSTDVTDVRAEYVADPFIVRRYDNWYIFFEVMNERNHQGDIGLASSKDGRNWEYEQIVLDEPFHVSYPYVFKYEDDYYMIPESHETCSIRLYKAINFPIEWLFVKTLLQGRHYVDSSIFTKGGKWWMFTTPTLDNDILLLYCSDDLLGDWIEHPMNPIIDGNANMARSAGRVLVYGARIIRYAQDCDPTYGKQVRAFEIEKLTTTDYKEHEIGIVLKATESGCFADGMHHIDLHHGRDCEWTACVDGYEIRRRLVFGWDR